MTRKLLIPALIAASLAASVSVATAGTVFDFVPRMEFYDQPELVTKAKSKELIVCDASKTTVCSVDLKSLAPKTPKNTDK
jgi:hypothetical protein